MMAKKSFTGGLSSVLGEKKKVSEKSETKETEKGQGPGRPKTNLTKEARATFVLDTDILEDIEALSFYDRKTKKGILIEAIELLKKKRGPEHLEAAKKEFLSRKK